MYPEPPPGQGPLDPRGAFSPPTPPGQRPGPAPAPGYMPPPPGGYPPPGMMPPMMPPPGFMPPPMYMMPPPRRRSIVRGIFTFLAFSALSFSILLNIILLARSGFGGGSSGLRQTTVVRGNVREKIALLPMTGLIDDSMSARFDRFMRSAEEDGNVKGIVIQLDSPGGTVSASDEIYHRIQKFKTNRPGTPVVVAQASLAASGGYYVSCGGDYIFAQPTTLTGNIGVIMPRFNIHKLMEEWGIEETTLTSKGANFKNAGSMFKPVNPEDEAYMQDILDKAFTQFKAVVSAGRKMNSAQVDKVANGKIYTAQDALAIKLIDEIGYAEDACDYVAKKAGLKNRTIVKYQDPPSFFELLESKSNVPSPAATNVTINGVNVDRSSLVELMTPRLMYLCRGE